MNAGAWAAVGGRATDLGACDVEDSPADRVCVWFGRGGRAGGRAGEDAVRADRGQSTVATIDTATNIPGTALTFPGGSSPWAAAFSPTAVWRAAVGRAVG